MLNFKNRAKIKTYNNNEKSGDISNLYNSEHNIQIKNGNIKSFGEKEKEIWIKDENHIEPNYSFVSFYDNKIKVDNNGEKYYLAKFKLSVKTKTIKTTLIKKSRVGVRKELKCDPKFIEFTEERKAKTIASRLMNKTELDKLKKERKLMKPGICLRRVNGRFVCLKPVSFGKFGRELDFCQFHARKKITQKKSRKCLKCNIISVANNVKICGKCLPESECFCFCRRKSYSIHTLKCKIHTKNLCYTCKNNKSDNYLQLKTKANVCKECYYSGKNIYVELDGKCINSSSSGNRVLCLKKDCNNESCFLKNNGFCKNHQINSQNCERELQKVFLGIKGGKSEFAYHPCKFKAKHIYNEKYLCERCYKKETKTCLEGNCFQKACSSSLFCNKCSLKKSSIG